MKALTKALVHRPHRFRLAAAGLAALGITGAAWTFRAPGILIAAALAALGGLLGRRVARSLEPGWLRRRARRTGAHPPAGASTPWDAWPVATETRRAVERELDGTNGTELVLAHFDADGRIHCRFGELPGLARVGDADYEPRERHPLALVLRQGQVLVRKDFRNRELAFLREWHHLARLAGYAKVPAVAGVDEERRRLYKGFLSGPTLRAVLAAAGAKILTVDTRDDPELAALAPSERTEAVWARGRALLQSSAGAGFRRRLERQVDAVHALGITGMSLTFGNIVLGADDQEPWLIDFESARAHRLKWGPSFIFRRQQDRAKLRRIYGPPDRFEGNR